MHAKTRAVNAVMLLGLIAALVAPQAVLSAKQPSAAQQQLDPALCSPTQNTFSLTIDNRYFPLPVGQQWVYQGKEQGETLGLRITVLNQTEQFRFGRTRVTTRVVEEVEWVDANANGVIDPDESLIERSLNYFAQTQDGTVCYFGEIVDIFEDGEVVSHEGSWRADARGNAPGVFMPADPQPGTTFAQENAPGIAEDEATILRFVTAKTPAGTFTDAIRVRDFNPLDGSSGIKAYAAGVGLVIDGPLELISF
jgi:hypothetical protein